MRLPSVLRRKVGFITERHLQNPTMDRQSVYKSYKNKLNRSFSEKNLSIVKPCPSLPAIRSSRRRETASIVPKYTGPILELIIN